MNLHWNQRVGFCPSNVCALQKLMIRAGGHDAGLHWSFLHLSSMSRQLYPGIQYNLRHPVRHNFRPPAHTPPINSLREAEFKKGSVGLLWTQR